MSEPGAVERQFDGMLARAVGREEGAPFRWPEDRDFARTHDAEDACRDALMERGITLLEEGTRHIARLRAVLQQCVEALEDLVPLAREAMNAANNDGVEYEIKAELSDARAALAASRAVLEREVSIVERPERPRGAGAAMREAEAAMKAARHSCVTVSGLYATDNFRAYGDAIDAGVDPDGAYNSFVEGMFQIDEAPTIAALDAALTAIYKALEPEVRG